MDENAKGSLFDFVVGGQTRVISFVRSEYINEGVEADLYELIDDPTHELAIYRVAEGFHGPAKQLPSDQTAIEGFVKGKGTLIVTAVDGSKQDYYFEKEDAASKEVAIQAGQSLQWTAPNENGLVYYELHAAVSTPDIVPDEPPPGEGRTAKLFLSSVAISDAQSAALAALVGKPPQEIKLALIENAAHIDVGSKSWVMESRKAIQSHGFDVELIDLPKYKDKSMALVQKLRGKDVIWFGGGNTFYLRWLLQETRADEIIKRLVTKGGVVYGGGSAGAIVAGPTLRYFEGVDDPSKVPAVLTDGLGLTDSVVVPHMDNPKFAQIVQVVNHDLLNAGFKTVPLNDNQALVIDGDKQQII